VFFSRFVFDQQLAELSDTIEKKESIVRSAQPFEHQIISIQNRLEAVKDLEVHRSQYVDVLRTIKQITPQDMKFTRIVLDESSMKLSGTTLSNESFARFITLLTDDPTYADISITNLEKNDDTGILVVCGEAKIRILPSNNAQKTNQQ